MGSLETAATRPATHQHLRSMPGGTEPHRVPALDRDCRTLQEPKRHPHLPGLPFSLAGWTLQGERPLKPLGFLASSLLVVAVLSILIHALFRKKLAAWRQRQTSTTALVSRVVGLALFFVILAVPFLIPLDFF